MDDEQRRLAAEAQHRNAEINAAAEHQLKLVVGDLTISGIMAQTAATMEAARANDMQARLEKTEAGAAAVQKELDEMRAKAALTEPSG